MMMGPWATHHLPNIHHHQHLADRCLIYNQTLHQTTAQNNITMNRITAQILNVLHTLMMEIVTLNITGMR